MTTENEAPAVRNTVEVPVADLLRVTPFKGHDDIRYYLNGVLVTPYQDHALLVATNGHWMAIYESAAAHTDEPRLLDLPTWFVNQMERLERGRRLDGESVDFDDEDEDEHEDDRSYSSAPKTLIVETPTSRLTIHESHVEQLIKPGAPFLDNKFPDWQKVLPDPSQLERGLFSPFGVNYLAELYRAVPNDREYPLFCYQNRDTPGPGVFRFGGLPGLVAVLMPRRDADKESKDWPAWMQKEPAP